MSIERLLRDYNIPFVMPGEHHHCSEGWVNINCPFCGGDNYHLGINTEHSGSHCWRCGGHHTTKVISKVLDISNSEANGILTKYQRGGKATTKEAKVSIYPLKLPYPTIKLNEVGKRYLRGRGFDPERLEREWGVLQTGPTCFLDMARYDNRILIPIYWGREMVSFQSRDITGESEKKYLACPSRREKTKHKNVVYGKEERWPETDSLIIVEGITDVWRLGGYSVATFGISFTTEQVLLLSKMAGRFFIIFDNEPQAQEQARKLAVKLKALGRRAYVETVEEDPGSMKQEEADYLVKNLLK